MAEKLDFNSLANTKAGDVKAPTLLPIGHYLAMIAGAMTPHPAKSGNVAMRFPISILSAEDDVDQEQLEAAGGIPDKKYNMDFWMSQDAQYRFTDFVKSCGLFDENLTLVQLAERLVEEQTQFLIEVKHEPNEDPDKPPFMRLDNPVGNAGE